MATRLGRANSDVNLQLRTYYNGTLFNPYNLGSVRVMTATSGGDVLATLTPTTVSTGVHEATWSVGNIASGIYYDEWTWTAENGMTAKVQTYDIRIDAPVAAPTGTTRTGPLFVGKKEIDFFNGINKELLQKIVCQQITYYSVSLEHTNSHKLYDEAIRKTVFTPVDINALVLYKEPDQKADKFSIDTTYSIEVYFFQNELRERKLIPREGDFLAYGDITYEIEKLNKPQIIYGQIGNEVMVKANCRVARNSQFEIFKDS